MGEKLSVKQVIEMTGLNHKYLFKFEDVIPPVSRKNNGRLSVTMDGKEWRGYKEYDKDALPKLQLLKFLIELRVKKPTIVEIYSNPHMNIDTELEKVIDNLKMERERYDELIRKAETVKMYGLKNIFLNKFLIDNIASKDSHFNDISTSQEEIDFFNEYVVELNEKINALNQDAINDLREMDNKVIEKLYSGNNDLSELDEFNQIVEYLDSLKINIRPYLSEKIPQYMGKEDKSIFFSEEVSDVTARDILECVIKYLAMYQMIDILKVINEVNYHSCKVNEPTMQNMIFQLHKIVGKYQFCESKKRFKICINYLINSIEDMYKKDLLVVKEAVDYYCSAQNEKVVE